MVSIVLEKRIGALCPTDDVGRDFLDKIANGDLVRVKTSKLRNPRHHRLFFALVNTVFENQDHYQSVEHLLTALKVALGHCDTIICKDGNTAYIPKSISFAKMDQIEFDAFYSRTVDLVCKHFLPGVKSEDLRREIEGMIS